ncbi:unnamed protein product [Vitrella brassicaformis CCMP3155]|uniref:Protein kinase domain-containing protein n=1 Tax=Vitrella brassicaformis (strain CCMP3155) TaxID=1169540 RepID=A0A0G4H5H6_VITBC|nr:unnamed protein product [Vitrella brassicaformis CCMP3155]|eukprot:CEM39052.1 unnamed protein product [Vitrella brassicaformis CCMP3155]
MFFGILISPLTDVCWTPHTNSLHGFPPPEGCQSYPAGLPPAVLRWVLRQLLSAMAHLEENGVWHCDLKPENILVKHQEGRTSVNLADFGNSREVADTGRVTETEMQTPSHRAPEVHLKAALAAAANGRETNFPETLHNTAKTDMWSVATTAFKAAFGVSLFPYHNDARHMLRDIFSVMGVPKEEEWPGIADVLSQIGMELPDARGSSTDAIHRRLTARLLLHQKNSKAPLLAAANGKYLHEFIAFMDRLVCPPAFRMNAKDGLSHFFLAGGDDD